LIRAEENFAATAAAVQSILLGAASLGLLSFWSTGKLMRHPTTRLLLGSLDQEIFVGSLWLGKGPLPEVPPRKALSEVTSWWTSAQS
jgi:nitroreductase